MGFLGTVVVSLAVSVDALAVSVAGALVPSGRSRWFCAFNAAAFFGLFQFVMPLLGYFLAGAVSGWVEQIDHYVAFALLTLVGGRMILEALIPGRDKVSGGTEKTDFFAPRRLFIPAVATSIDALAVGCGMAFAGYAVWFPAVMMGIVTGAVSFAGVLYARMLTKLADAKILTVLGGAAIIAVGVNILLTHLEVY